METFTIGSPTEQHGTDPEDVLKGALEEGFDEVIVLGITKDGSDYYAVSNAFVPSLVFQIEKFKNYLLVERGIGG